MMRAVPEKEPVFKLKVCMIGDSAVGKTSLVKRFVLDQFSDRYFETLGVNALVKDVVVNGPRGSDVPARLVIWDVMGEPSYLEYVSDTYLYGTKGIVAVCDLTRFSTFGHLHTWMEVVEKTVGVVPKVLAVNKADLRKDALVLYDEHEVRRFAEDNKARVYMTSAKTGENVEEMFKGIASDIVTSALRTPLVVE